MPFFLLSSFLEHYITGVCQTQLKSDENPKNAAAPHGYWRYSRYGAYPVTCEPVLDAARSIYFNICSSPAYPGI